MTLSDRNRSRACTSSTSWQSRLAVTSRFWPTCEDSEGAASSRVRQLISIARGEIFAAVEEGHPWRGIAWWLHCLVGHCLSGRSPTEDVGCVDHGGYVEEGVWQEGERRATDAKRRTGDGRGRLDVRRGARPPRWATADRQPPRALSLFDWIPHCAALAELSWRDHDASSAVSPQGASNWLGDRVDCGRAR